MLFLSVVSHDMDVGHRPVLNPRGRKSWRSFQKSPPLIPALFHRFIRSAGDLWTTNVTIFTPFRKIGRDRTQSFFSFCLCFFTAEKKKKKIIIIIILTANEWFRIEITFFQHSLSIHIPLWIRSEFEYETWASFHFVRFFSLCFESLLASVGGPGFRRE